MFSLAGFAQQIRTDPSGCIPPATDPSTKFTLQLPQLPTLHPYSGSKPACSAISKTLNSSASSLSHLTLLFDFENSIAPLFKAAGAVESLENVSLCTDPSLTPSSLSLSSYRPRTALDHRCKMLNASLVFQPA
jgi:hypothetical protein